MSIRPLNHQQRLSLQSGLIYYAGVRAAFAKLGNDELVKERKMTKYSPVGVLLILLLCAVAFADQLPSGSYRQTCRNITISNDTLSAECRVTGGRWQRSNLSDYSRCRGGIMNTEGNLRCNMVAQLPGGSYRQSCRDITAANDTLTAICRATGGSWRRSDLGSYSRCTNGEIINFEGRLVCRPLDLRSLPSGSYQQTCRNIFLENDHLWAHCRDRGGDWRPTVVWNASRCSRVGNFDGQLACSSAPTGTPIGRPPIPMCPVLRPDLYWGCKNSPGSGSDDQCCDFARRNAGQPCSCP